MEPAVPKTGSEKSVDEKMIGEGEGYASVDLIDGIPDPDAHLSEAERKAIDRKLVWKLDLYLIPWLCVLYLLSFLDRTNIGNAKIDTLLKDLGHLTTGQYNAALTIFFVSYALFEPICNILLKRLRPSIFLPTIMVCWGLVMLCMGYVKTWSGLMAARFFLGVCEAGLYPGVNYFLSCWYKRDEFGIRAAVFFSAAAFSGSFGGLLAAAITHLRGKQGLAGWAWIFIIEGAVTMVLGALSFFFVQDFPDTATFLSPEDKARVLRRLRSDKQSSAQYEEFKWEHMWAALTDWKMYMGMFIYMGADMPLYGFSLFLPTIVKNMGYTANHAQLLSVPPYACAAVMTITIGYLADRTKMRGIWNMSVALIGIAGFAMLLASSKPHIQYAGTFLGALGIYPCIANTISWVSNNIEGVYKRGIVLGFVIGWGNLNGVVSSNIFFKSPRYTVGHATIMGYMIACLVIGSGVFHILLKRENAARLAGKRDHLVAGMSEKEAEKLGDRRPDFIYTT